jgi:hypothetical protein
LKRNLRNETKEQVTAYLPPQHNRAWMMVGPRSLRGRSCKIVALCSGWSAVRRTVWVRVQPFGPEESRPRPTPMSKAIRTHDPLFSSFIYHDHQDSLLYTYFSRTHPSFISSSIHCGTYLSLYLNVSM